MRAISVSKCWKSLVFRRLHIVAGVSCKLVLNQKQNGLLFLTVFLDTDLRVVRCDVPLQVLWRAVSEFGRAPLEERVPASVGVPFGVCTYAAT